MIDDKISKCNENRVVCEKERRDNLMEIGNFLHESVIVSNDEVREEDDHLTLTLRKLIPPKIYCTLHV